MTFEHQPISARAESVCRGVLKAATAALLAGILWSPSSQVLADALLFDLGADATQTLGGTSGNAVTWNNISNVGTDDSGLLENLVTTGGAATTVSFQMVSRFNGANENGTTANPEYPASATRDSLFGNTELFNGIENVTPIFKLTGLAPAAKYTLTLYASRLGVSDNRETRYTVTGASAAFVDLDVANNATKTVQVADVTPDAAGEITVALTPGPNNNNANHFVYLGVLKIGSSTGESILIDLGAGGSPTDIVEQPAAPSWNNITATLGGNPAGVVTGLVTTNGTASAIGFKIVSRFNGANENGATTATVFPATATRDSLYGNTEAFNGLTNILPSFKLTGLDARYLYSFTFYASRAGVADNRETRYTVTGANSSGAVATLNAANNTNATVSVTEIVPDAAGEITVALSPGPNNNNANHFTYLGAMRVDFGLRPTPRMLFDLGAAGRPTVADPVNQWNNITTDVGSTDAGTLTNLVLVDGTSSGVTFQMVSRFNGANENGTETNDLFPLDATRDSLFANTELFSDLENVTPIFKLTGLTQGTAYNFLFYASRLGVGDNRETRYTVTGATEAFAELNVANNEVESVTVTNMLPNAVREITIALTPGANNDNANHFIYLGVMQVDWAAPAPSAVSRLSGPAYAAGQFKFQLAGTVGKTYRIQRSRNLTAWQDAQTVTLTTSPQTVQIAQAESDYYYRAVEP